MPDLQTVIKALLHDLTMAQHQTNRATRRLVKKYRGDAILQHLPVPNAVIDEVELTLRFAVESVEETEGERFESAASRDFTPSRTIINQLAATIGDLFATELGNEIRSATSPDHPRREPLLASLAQAATREALAAHIAAALHAAWSSPEMSSLTSDPIDAGREEVTRRLTSALEGDEDLSSAIDSVAGAVSRAVSRAIEGHRDALAAALGESWSQSLLGASGGSSQSAINVILDGAKLARLPESVIQTLKIRFDLRSFRSVPGSEELHIIAEDR